MVDVVDKAVRSRMMSGIRGKHTKPERVLRTLLHQNGFRFRLHPTDVVGRPDLALKKYRVAVFVHGCFWHQHRGCRFAYQPASNATFWRTKLRGNARRDRLIEEALLQQGWRVLIVWECALRAKPEDLKRLQEGVSRWIRSRQRRRVLPVTPSR